MPITPIFKLSQTSDLILIEVIVPYIRVSSAETYIEGKEFSFWCKPYLLKLVFPHELQDDEQTKAIYDPNKENGTISFAISKAEPGLHFEDLDLTTNLLQPVLDPLKSNGSGPHIPVIEVLKSENFESEEMHPQPQTEGDSSPAPIFSPPPPPETDGQEARASIIIPTQLKYGFNNQYSGVFKNLREELKELMPLNPDTVSSSERSRLRVEAENNSFDSDRYLGDTFHGEEDYIYTEAMAFNPHWEKQCAQHQETQELSMPSPTTDQPSGSGTEPGSSGFDGFSTDENTLMSKLPNKEYLIQADSSDEHALLLGLSDLLFAYAYDHRTTLGDPSVESAWTVATLSPSLSWFEDYHQHIHPPASRKEGFQQVSKTCLRRAITYPYLRSWNLAIKVLGDMLRILQLGKRCVLRCLLQVYKILEKTETHYLLNKLFLLDYCVWIQKINDSSLQRFAREFKEYRDVHKAEIGFDLVSLEKAYIASEDSSDLESSSDEMDSSSDSEKNEDLSQAVVSTFESKTADSSFEKDAVNTVSKEVPHTNEGITKKIRRTQCDLSDMHIGNVSTDEILKRRLLIKKDTTERRHEHGQDQIVSNHNSTKILEIDQA